ncbi:MAG: hypothetical protein ACI8W7_004284 [Gammaproteobacteria bacterium]|jgi:hypothetical protein
MTAAPVTRLIAYVHNSGYGDLPERLNIATAGKKATAFRSEPAVRALTPFSRQ